ncbi:zonular occludens toxin domain-containing protein [Delftia acidovorans]|uniref:zonular occludens toxin domain-containing protein n=1 Tax=Delftia acidovorans TaxID=80866 RepID=UPI0028A72F30|nr:zonular occludens toxin domain-containing protein [Delftia acidovorans]
MLYLITGANGAGKTLNTLKWVRERSVKEGRPVCHNGRFEPVEGGELSNWKRIDFKDWQKEPDGTIFLIDECHNDMPVRGASATVPDEIRMLAEHRRRGMDFYLVTQHPQNIDNFVRRLVGSPGWHRHLKRTFGADLVSCIEWAAVNPNCEKDGSGKTGTVSMVGFPKEVYGWYKSASLHTGKKKIPRAVWTALAAVILAPTMIYFAVSGVYKNVAKGKAEPVATAGASQASGRAGNEGRVLTAAEYVDARVPRIPGFPHSAPAYDAVTQPVEAPYPAACVVMRGECKCYTQQATLLYMPEGLCKHIVERGFFVDFKLPSREAPRRSTDQPRHEARPSQQHPPQQLQVVVAPLAQQDPGAAYLQGLSARNAQVRSGLQ